MGGSGGSGEFSRGGEMVKQVLLDTNIYGVMVIDFSLDLIKERLSHKKDLIIFGSKVIRKELRATPTKIKMEGSNLRIDMLTLYDELTQQRTIDITSEMEELAGQYYLSYAKLGGSEKRESIWSDFLIVATATLKQMDIVISNDENTMKSKEAKSGYELVNEIRKLRNPQFLNYEQFKELLR